MRRSHPHSLHPGIVWIGTLLTASLSLTCATALAGDSINWTSTVGPQPAALVDDGFRYIAEDTPDARKQACELECRPLPAGLTLSAEQRLDQRLRYGYRKLGEDLAARLWDDPRGRRIRFDVAGRPGLGLEIPFD